MGVADYKQLEVWQAGVRLCVRCYRVTASFPRHEQFGLTSQTRRAAVSIAANIAEGQARFSTREFLRYVSIAYGSLAELETHLAIAKQLEYLSGEDENELAADSRRVGQLLNGLARALRAR